MPSSRHFHRKAFTLIEMVVVVAIISLITAATYAALSGSGVGSKLVSGGNTVSNLAMVGRQNSLARNAMTALVMIANSGTEGDYRAFGLFEIVPRTDGEPAVAGDWRQITAWETMTDGVVVDECTFATNSTTMAPPFPAFSYRGKAVTSYQYVVFVPNGSLLRSDPSYVRLVPGFRAPGAATVTYTAEKGPDSKAANYYQVSLLPASGRSKVQRP